MYKTIFLLAIFASFFCYGFTGLLITEVSFDGTDERIELTNTGSENFSGSIELVWVKSSPVTVDITISPDQSIILGDKLESNVPDLSSIFYIRDLWFSIGDGSPWTLQVSHSETLSDEFTISQELLDEINNTNLTAHPAQQDGQTVRTSAAPSPGIFERIMIEHEEPESGIWTWDVLTGETDMGTWDMSDWDSGTWFNDQFSWDVDDIDAWDIDLDIGTWDVDDVGTWTVMTWDIQDDAGPVIATGSIDNETQETNVQDEDLPEDDLDTSLEDVGEEIEPEPELFDWDLEIIEIHPSDVEWVGEYIKILAHIDWSWSFDIVWLGRGQSRKTITFDFVSGQELVITDKPDHIPGSLWLSSISLTDDGEELMILWQSGQQIDKAVYEAAEKGEILLYSYTEDGARVFAPVTESAQESEQGPEDSNTEDLPEQNERDSVVDNADEAWHMDCSIVIQNKDVVHAESSINFITRADNKEIQNSARSYRCHREWVPIGFGADKCNPSSLKAEDRSQDMVLTVHHTDWRRCQTMYRLNVSIPEPSCRQEYYEELYHKRKDKYTNECSSSSSSSSDSSSCDLSFDPEPREDIQLASPEVQSFVWNKNTFLIESVLPNPSGADGESEWIRISNLGDAMFRTEGLIINAGKRQADLPVVDIAPWETKEVTANLALYNSSSCIRLQSETGTIYDEFCYPKPKDDIWYTRDWFEAEIFDGSNNSEIIIETIDVSEEIRAENEDPISLVEPDEDVSILGGPPYRDLQITWVMPNPDWADSDREWIRITNVWTKDMVAQEIRLVTGKRSTLIKIWPLVAWEEQELTDKLGLYNSAECVIIEFTDETQTGELCYPKPKSDTWYPESEQNNIESQMDDLVAQDIQSVDKALVFDDYSGDVWDEDIVATPDRQRVDNLLVIQAILPNPDWADSDREWLSLINISEATIIRDDLWINAGKRRKSLWSVNIDPGETTLIQANLWLYNRPACVRLESIWWNIFDEFCYPKPKDDIRYSHGNDFVELAQADRMSSIKLRSEWSQMCVYSGDNLLMCADSNYASKYTKEQEKSDALKLENKLHRQFIYWSIASLRKDRYPVYESTIQSDYHQWKEFLTLLDSGITDFAFWPIGVQRSEVDTAFRLHTNEIPLEDINVQEFYEPLMENTKSYLDWLWWRLVYNK